jgi:hypothetical protein
MIHIDSRTERSRIRAIQSINAQYADRKVKAVQPKCTHYCGKGYHINCPYKKELRA